MCTPSLINKLYPKLEIKRRIKISDFEITLNTLNTNNIEPDMKIASATNFYQIFHTFRKHLITTTLDTSVMLKLLVKYYPLHADWNLTILYYKLLKFKSLTPLNIIKIGGKSSKSSLLITNRPKKIQIVIICQCLKFMVKED